jgi:3-oxoacyl-(acyl-carrier-protein) synthase
MAAGSGVDAATAVLSLHNQTVPPAINTKNILDNQRLNVAAEPRGLQLDTAISSVYSLGGQNAALVFKKV